MHWFGKKLEEMIQKQIKIQQNVAFLENELETRKKNSASNLKAQNIFLKSLENQNTELMTERAIAVKQMQLLEVCELIFKQIYIS